MEDDGKSPPAWPAIRWETGYPPHRTFGEWHEDPWANPEDKARRRRERHARWIASISDRDWHRLADLADQALGKISVERLDDLDATIAIGVHAITESHPPNGERFGVLRGCMLLAWPKDPGRR
jgi:hypothetical protein